MIKAKRKSTFVMAGLGDDLLLPLKSVEDLPRFARIIRDTFGMEISVDSIKTAVGIDFLQELY